MERLTPRTTSDEIDLYIRTYTSLLRSSGEVRVRAFEEAHAYSSSSLHTGARDPAPDLAAFGYSAARLPPCMHRVRRVVLGQSHEQFEAEGLDVRGWERVRSRGRRRPLRFDGDSTLAVFVTSATDVDDLVPILTAYQIEWNKLHALLSETHLGELIRSAPEERPLVPRVQDLADEMGLSPEEAGKLLAVLQERSGEPIRALASERRDLTVRLFNGSFAEYQRAAQRWWSGIEPAYLRAAPMRRPPVYFVSSNSHSFANLLGGYALENRRELLDWVRRENPEDLAPAVEKAEVESREDELSNLSYYLLRAFIHGDDERRQAVQRSDESRGIRSIESPGHVDVSAQVIELGRLPFAPVDQRVRVPGFERLGGSDAVILNIDYPLGLAAYHHLSRIAQGIGELRGIYLMGKAATLNGRVGDVMLSNVVHDEHSKNTYLFRNGFTASQVQSFLGHGTVLDNQKALTVRGAFLQNREYMSVFYREGYTVLEMEAGPYLSAVYETVNPKRHPNDEIVQLASQTAVDVGVLHYASDTPYSRRQSLLSKSLSYFGVDSTYACAIAILRRIFDLELVRRQAGGLPS